MRGDPRRWTVSVDTGGTFTDCVARDLEGRRHRVKVLSSSALRGLVLRVINARTLLLDDSWPAVSQLLRGGTFRLLEAPAAPSPEVSGVEVLSYQPVEVGGKKGVEVQLASPLTQELEPGARCEIRSTDEAPVLAARVLTGTAADAALPPLALRLATTRGTNALLERRGARCLLLITRGFGDLLRIGTQQRPDLFALEVRKPEPLTTWVVEIPERQAADGSVLEALPEMFFEPERLRAWLHEQGVDLEQVESAAVAVLHAYREASPERRWRQALESAGIPHVSNSADLAPRLGLLTRTETTVVDAYLLPVIHRYLERVEGALGGNADGQASTLHVMTSAGGLVGTGLAGASRFRAKDSLLSGPAGGVVGAARAGCRVGLDHVIAFDMGGTSTDVARYSGDFEYLFEHQVGDAHLAAPALAIESVAAGGGSICSFDGHQLRVGPQSAGADPGPACYGAGGTLTLTDCNLLLGRLDPSRFGIPVDRAAAERALDAVLQEVPVEYRKGSASATESRRETLLSGFLAIADERMADAIRAISVRRGYDPADHVLVAFGGAGAQHACAVAEQLGITTVIVPPDAGLLSAVGLEVAVIERFAERQVLLAVEEAAEKLATWFEVLADQALADLRMEGVSTDEAQVRRRLAFLRFAGQESTVELEFGAGASLGAAELETRFLDAYEQLYGYRPERRSIEVESLRVVASSPAEEIEAVRREAVSVEVPVNARAKAYFEGAWQDVPVLVRGELLPGHALEGPALVVEAHSATVVLPGWRLRVVGEGEEGASLVLERRT